MTNLEYIKSNMTDRDFADLFLKGKWATKNCQRITYAYRKWGERFGDHKGNTVNEKGNPSIHLFEVWFYPDGHKENKGVPKNVSFQVWLCDKYNKEDWPW